MESVSRTASPGFRVLIATAGAATNLLKVGELEDRVAHLEAAVAGHTVGAGDGDFELP